MIVFPNCKINLGLYVTKKRADGFHDIETVFYPIAVHDALEIIDAPSSSKSIEFITTGAAVIGDNAGNICVQAYNLLKKNFPDLPFIKMHLHKKIPVGAGLGGGSADGAFTLKLLNKKFNLAITEADLSYYASQLGSDCAFFIKNSACYASGRGEILENIRLDLGAYKFVLVNPGIHINTGWAFTQITPCERKTSLKEVVQQPVARWSELLQNDFEEAVSLHHPQIKEIKKRLYDEGAVYASMTGSGSSVFGIFKKEAVIPLSFPPQFYVKTI